jgi:alpha-L-arabinofuranosidase
VYALCEYVGADPWHSLPGTLSYDEMKNFMEYLGAPPDVGYGKVRAELGHPKPWTEVFRRIHVEFGNEAWNNAGPYQCGGFNGDDYWKDLFALGRKSPYYKPNVVFHAAGQAANSWLNRAIFARVPNADRFGVAPYIIHSFTKAQADALNTDENLFAWAFAYPLWYSRHKDGPMFQNRELAQKSGIELSVYEMNHHITGGDGPLEPRNKIVTSIGGGLNVANTMLLMMKELHTRTQCLFSLVQHSYNAQGVGAVRLWGTALNMRKGRERYRPTFLACMLANKAIGGDLVETVQSGLDPKFSVTGVFGGRKGEETLENLPKIWSYAFADGKKRGLILVNLDTSSKQPVVVKWAGDAAGNAAQSWSLSADSITANNEFEVEKPQVEIREEKIADFASGKQLTLAPFSMRALAWETK